MADGWVVLGLVQTPPLEQDDDGPAIVAGWISAKPLLLFENIEVHQRAPQAIATLASNAIPQNEIDAWKTAGRFIANIRTPQSVGYTNPDYRGTSRWYAQLPDSSSTVWDAVRQAGAETSESTIALPKKLEDIAEFEDALRIASPQIRSANGRIQRTEYFKEELRTVLGDIREAYEKNDGLMQAVQRLVVYFPLRLSEGSRLSDSVGALLRGNKVPIELFLSAYEQRVQNTTLQ